MKLGIKVGTKSNWKTDLESTRPDFCEIWFDSRYPETYDDLFDFLKREKISSGIHFWGATPENILANFGYPDQKILDISLQLAITTIHKAAQQNCVYVNFHPSNRTLTHVNFVTETFTPITEIAPYPQVISNMTESIRILSNEAQIHGIPLLLESVPARDMGGGKANRDITANVGSLSIQEMLPLLEVPNTYFANDFGHTVSGFINPSRKKAVEYLFNIARRLKDKTRLLHIGYIIPPYNGVDYHGTLVNDEFLTDVAIPNRTEVIELLTLYQRDDVFALVEPEKDHVSNFQVLQKLITESF